MTGQPRGFLRLVTGVVLAVSALAVSASSGGAQAPAAFVEHASARPVPQITFEDGHGDPIGLAAFRGKVVLLNIWATWCTPCRREMPMLDRLQAELGGAAFEVVALSVDRQGRWAVGEFYHELGLRQLRVFVDRSADAPRQLNTLGIPTTLLIDREGREIGRLLGPAEWDSPEIIAFIRERIQRSEPATITTSGREDHAEATVQATR